MSVTITLTLGPDAAAALKRFAEKISFEQANAVLYGHVKKDLREMQAGEIIAAFSLLEAALTEAGVASWPWIETGRTS
jgi:hypothetical protein